MIGRTARRPSAPARAVTLLLAAGLLSLMTATPALADLILQPRPRPPKAEPDGTLWFLLIAGVIVVVFVALVVWALVSMVRSR